MERVFCYYCNMENQKDIIISEGSLPFLSRCLAAVFYLICIGIIADILFKILSGAGVGAIIESSFNISFGLVSLSFALRYSLIKNIHVKIAERQYKQEYAVGPFVCGKWKPLPDVEYISKFRQAWSHDKDKDGYTDATGHNYDVNIWHSTSKHFTIYTSVTPEPAFEMGKYLAKKLEVDLLDATIPNNFKWLEVESQIEDQPA